MKVIIAGPRDLVLCDNQVQAVIEKSPFDIEEIVEGGATGVDSSAAWYAQQRGIPYRTISAEWREHGRAAGPMRNRRMAEYADALLVIKRHGLDSKGTTNMIEEAKRRALPIHLEEV